MELSKLKKANFILEKINSLESELRKYSLLAEFPDKVGITATYEEKGMFRLRSFVLHLNPSDINFEGFVNAKIESIGNEIGLLKKELKELQWKSKTTNEFIR